MHSLLLAAAIALHTHAAPWCIPDATITAYVRTAGSSRTYDGTSVYTPEPIAAASWNIPIDALVEVEGIGTYRVADRGHLGYYGWVDIAMWTYSEAINFGRINRQVCVYEPD